MTKVRKMSTKKIVEIFIKFVICFIVLKFGAKWDNLKILQVILSLFVTVYFIWPVLVKILKF